MKFNVKIMPDNYSLQVSPNETILDSALKNNFNMPYSCHIGICGTCKGKVLRGKFKFDANQYTPLTSDEISNNIVLFCCTKPESDLVVKLITTDLI